MDPLAFFDCTKEIPKIKLYSGARREMRDWKVASIAAASECGSTCGTSEYGSVRTAATAGTSYAEEYIRQEERELFEASQIYQKEEDEACANVSLVTDGPAMNEVLNEELTRIYKTYNFAHHSKPNVTIESMREKIITTIEGEPVTIIQGPTGCGKTTQVPQYILESRYEKKLPCNIIVTQPRRIAAISIAKRVCDERQWPLGGLVGYAVGLSSCRSNETRLTYCTTGVLLQKLITAKNMNEFTHVIIDEVHERDQDMDFLLLVVRKLMRTNSRKVRVIMMSATFNTDKFATYFSTFLCLKLVPAKVIDVTKRNYYHVSHFYLDDIREVCGGNWRPPILLADEPHVSEEIMKKCTNLLAVFDYIDDSDEAEKRRGRFTVLIFLPGIHEIEEMYNLLTEKHAEENKWDILVLHSSITTEEQSRIFEPPPQGFRRIILSTNIAESSITVPDVKYVIDFCLTKQLATDPSTNYQRLELTWASKANCEQRAGRAGRVMDGRVYRLVTEEFYNSFTPENEPEITKAPLEVVVLRAKMLDMGSPKALLALAMSPPDLSNLERTILLLKETGGLLNVQDNCFDGDLTDLGRVMAHLPVDIHVSKMIMLGQVFSVLRETIIIGASMSVKNMFSTPYQKRLLSYKTKKVWDENSLSDAAAFLNVYTNWQQKKMTGRLKTSTDEKNWATSGNLQIRVLREVAALVKEITGRLEGLGIRETVGSQRVHLEEVQRGFVIKIAIAGAFYPHYFITQPEDDERSKIKVLGGMDPTKTVYLQGWPTKQPGLLYARSFQKIFSDCLDSNVGKIKVKFDHSSRVYIQFNHGFEKGQPTDSPGEIAPAVYRALKLRQVDQRVKIPVLPADLSTTRANELGLEQPDTTLLLSTNSRLLRAPEKEIRPILPRLSQSKFQVVMRLVRDPSNFWVSFKDSTTRRNYTLINEAVEGMTSKTYEQFTSPPEIGSLVLAPRMVRNVMVYQRGIVQGMLMENKKNIFALIFFLDYGMTMQLLLSELRRLPEGHPIAKIPALSFECTLANIRPCILNSLNGIWSRDAQQSFQKIISNSPNFHAEVYSVTNGIANIKLTAVDKEDEKKRIVINDFLIEKGFAEYREEDYYSKYNHGLRKQVEILTENELLNHEEMQHNQNYLTDKYVESPAQNECRFEVVLKGPYSPLEVKLGSLINAGIGRKITVAETSVNCVLLDSTLVDPKERLLVAGTVFESHNSQRLTLHNTVLMPNIAGLTSLLCLIFAPRIELRRNFYKTRYCGALCGLGYEEKNRTSLFPAHDINIDFDVEITIDDVQNINCLRHWMSACIAVIDDENQEEPENIAICQNQVKKLLFKIVEKVRKPIARESVPNGASWCLYPDNLFLVPGSVAQLRQNIFRLHNGLDLEEKNEDREIMLNHLDEMRHLASQSIKDVPSTVINCKLCATDMFGVLQVRSHINSREHHIKEAQFRRL